MPLGEPTDLKDALDRVSHNGCLRPIVATPIDRLPPVLACHTSHVLSIIAMVLSVGLFILVGLFLLCHFKLWTLVAGLTLATAPKVVEVCPQPTMMVVCSNPYLTILAMMVTIIATGMWICTHCHNLTWLRGYKYSCACTFSCTIATFMCPLKLNVSLDTCICTALKTPLSLKRCPFTITVCGTPM